MNKVVYFVESYRWRAERSGRFIPIIPVKKAEFIGLGRETPFLKPGDGYFREVGRSSSFSM